ncbi:tctex1 domain-containing protein 1 [Aplysia californica]|uniref:Tctex1 domain-containing protein 1 n=1 Tax=Aplysia californica TaxID=6500 RepID=A0ABM0JDK1_APLCA|nr:tctex1 domain-containing protein 1 [Aplysia californica]
MEGFRKLMAKAGSMSDKKSESSADNSTNAKMKLGRFRLKMRMLSNLGGSRALQSQQTIVTYEPTYKLEPENDKKFSTQKAEAVIAGVFEHYLQGKKYDPKVFPRLIKTLTELIRDRVKMQGLDRYKILATVTILENKEQGIQLSSRALWNHAHDNYASLAYEGPNYFAVGSVYAVYYD